MGIVMFIRMTHGCVNRLLMVSLAEKVYALKNVHIWFLQRQETKDEERRGVKQKNTFDSFHHRNEERKGKQRFQKS